MRSRLLFASLVVLVACASGSHGSDGLHGPANSASPLGAAGAASRGKALAAALTELPVAADTILQKAPGESVFAPLASSALTVSDRGDAQYHVPVWVPPGRAGAQPNLAIDYSGSAGNGLLGMGWNLTGLSRITRCPRPRVNGVTPPPVLFNDQDGYCLDGEPLVADAADYGYLHTIRDSFSRVVVTTTDALGPVTFEVHFKDGHVSTYGATTDSRLERSAFEQPARLAWALSRVTDPAGNFFTATYQASAGGDLLPARMDYTGSRSDPTTRRSVTFDYDAARTDVPRWNVGGVPFSLPERLTRIALHAPNEAAIDPLRVYTLGYEQAAVTGRSRVSTLTSCDGTSSPICQSSSFKYTEGSSNFSDVTGDSSHAPMNDVALKGTGGPRPRLQLMDVNGDGKDDILYRGSAQPNFSRLRLSVGNTFGPSTPQGLMSSYTPSFLPPGPFVLDYDGDGHADLLSNVGSYDQPHAVVYLARGSGDNWSLGATPSASIDIFGYAQVEAVDLDGDRRPDILASHATAGGIGLLQHDYWLNDGSNHGGAPLGASTPFPAPLSPGHFFIDVNGDGATDLVGDNSDPNRLCPHNLDALSLLPNFAYSATALTTSFASCVDPNHSVRPDGGAGPRYDPIAPDHTFGDFDGDGVVDDVRFLRIIGTETDRDNSATLSLGGHGPFASWPAGQVPLMAIRTIDANLDGQEDLLVRQWDGVFNALAVYAYDRTTGSLAPAGHLNLALPEEEPDPNDGTIVEQIETGDVNGDGLQDIVYLSEGELHVATRQGDKPDLLVSATGTLGPTSMVTYKVYGGPDDAPECHYPIHCVHGGMRVVDTASVEDGLGGWHTQSHALSGGRADLAEGAFLGFVSHTITDQSTGEVTVRHFSFNAQTIGGVRFYATAGMPDSEASSVTVLSPAYKIPTIPTTQLAVEVTRSSVRSTSYGVSSTLPFTVFPNQVYEASSDSATGWQPVVVSSHLVSERFDPYGNLVLRDESWPREGTRLETLNSYQYRPDTWRMALPRLKTITSTAASGDTATRQTGYDFDADGLPLRVTANPGADRGDHFDPLPPQSDGVQTVYTVYARNGNGLPTATTIEDDLAAPTASRTTTVGYDSSEGMFPVAAIDALGHVAQSAYEPGLGVVATSTDVNGLVTTYHYDTFGRVRMVVPPTGDVAATTFSGADRAGVVTSVHLGHATVATTLDALQRPIATGSGYRADGRAVYTTTAYDSLGHAWRKSRPFFNADAPAYEDFSYDSLGRVVSVTYPDKSSEQIAIYGTGINSVDSNGQFTVTTVDTMGRTVNTQQLASAGSMTSMTMEYGPFDTLTSVTDTNGNVTRTVFDRLGRPRLSIDPDRGASKVTYDIFGDVASTVRGGTWTIFDVVGGTQTTTVRDALGRITSVVAPDVVQTTTWDSAANGVGRIASESIKGGATITYQYDALSRPAWKTWGGFGESPVSIGYTYDAYGRPDTIVYPPVSGVHALPIGPQRVLLPVAESVGGQGLPPPPPVSLVVKRSYSAGGQLTSVADLNDGHVYWSLVSSDATESFATETMANGVTVTSAEDPKHLGWLGSLTSTANGQPVQTLHYYYQGHGQLAERDDTVNGTTETFKYDYLNRLTKWDWSGAAGERVIRYDYDDVGNLTARNVLAGPAATTTYTFNQFGPHQPDSNGTDSFTYDARGNQTTITGGTTITYNSFDLPTSVAKPNQYASLITYDPELRRLSRNEGDESTHFTFGGLFERYTDTQNTTHYLLTVSAGKPVAQIEMTLAGNKTTRTDTTILADRLGSVDALVTASGVEQVKYDPFGLRVQAADPFVRATAAPDDVHAGFTGHDQDDDLSLIDMVGRVYDPVAQRFVSQDPVPPSAADSRARNPYAYVRHNPLGATDPSGFIEVDVSDMRNGSDDTDLLAMGFLYGYSSTAQPQWSSWSYGLSESQGSTGQSGPGTSIWERALSVANYSSQLELKPLDDEPTPPETPSLDEMLGNVDPVSDTELLALGRRNRPSVAQAGSSAAGSGVGVAQTVGSVVGQASVNCSGLSREAADPSVVGSHLGLGAFVMVGAEGSRSEASTSKFEGVLLFGYSPELGAYVATVGGVVDEAKLVGSFAGTTFAVAPQPEKVLWSSSGQTPFGVLYVGEVSVDADSVPVALGAGVYGEKGGGGAYGFVSTWREGIPVSVFAGAGVSVESMPGAR